MFDRAGRDGALPESLSLWPSFRPFGRFGVVEVFGCGLGYASDPAAANCPRSTFLNRASAPVVLIYRRIDACSVACGVLPLGMVHNPRFDVASTIECSRIRLGYAQRLVKANRRPLFISQKSVANPFRFRFRFRGLPSAYDLLSLGFRHTNTNVRGLYFCLWFLGTAFLHGVSVVATNQGAKSN
jgi:hypothetical protein